MLLFGHSVDANGTRTGATGAVSVVASLPDAFSPAIRCCRSNSSVANVYAFDNRVFVAVARAFAAAILAAYLRLSPKITYRYPTRITSKNMSAYSNANRINTDGPEARKNVPKRVRNSPSLAKRSHKNEINRP